MCVLYMVCLHLHVSQLADFNQILLYPPVTEPISICFSPRLVP
jgi:hypothetical protein